MNLYDYLIAEVNHGDVAVITTNEEVTYGQLIEAADQIGSTLRELGIKPGDRVGILADNSPFWIASYLGAIKVGAVAAPFPSRLTGEGLQQLDGVTACSTFCFDQKHLTKYGSDLPHGSSVITSKVQQVGDAAARPYLIVPVREGSTPTVTVDDRTNLAALMFTSGSTGQPNAVKVSHRNIIANTDSIIQALGISRSDRMMVVLPFDYCFGTSLLHTHLRVGGTLVLNNGFQYLEDVLNDLERHACTSFAGVPLIYQQLLRKSSFPRRTWPHLRHAQQAGGKLPDVFIREFLAAAPTTDLHIMYGQTEATARLSFLPSENLDNKLGSIGRGMPGVALRIVNAAGDGVAPGEVGEIVAEGDNVTLGYWVPDPAKNNFRDGKLYTGDLAQMDADGFVYIVGRASDFVKPMGHRISCREIEDVLVEMPQIAEVAVVGVANPEVGEIVRAYIVTVDGNELQSTQVRQFCRGKLAEYAVPREFHFLSELPRNGSQKVLKSLLPV